MKLRVQLSLFFGGLMAAVLTLVVVTNYNRLHSTLEKDLERQFSLEPYLQVADVERTLLLERANALVDRVPVLNGVRSVNRILEDPGKGLSALNKLRESPDHDAGVLSSIYDQMLQVLSRVEADEGQDLVVLASFDGTIIAEAFNEVLGKVSPTLKVTTASLEKEKLWSVLGQLDSGRGYLIYPNGNLYLYGFASFRSRYKYEGVAVVGEEVDRKFLSQLGTMDSAHTAGHSEDEQTMAVVVFGDKVVANSDAAEKVGRELSKAKGVTEGDWTAAGGKTFLVKSAPLYSYYLSSKEQKKFSDLGLTADLPSNDEVGRVFLLKDASGIQRAAFEGARETLVVGVLALAVTLLVIPLLANRLTGPIEFLSEAMKKVGEGELKPLPQTDRQLSSITEVKDAAESFNQMVIGLKQKRILEHFVPEGTRREIEELQGGTAELGGKRWERTIMFSDLRGFTSMSESMTPDEVMAVLNKYLHVMSKAVRENGGDINEYIGDAILAVFETPDQAVKAGIAMSHALVELRKDTSIKALAGLSQGIGLHTGPLVEGNIGEENRRLKRAVIGDTVNLAARIQDRSRDGKHSCIFLSQSSKDRLSEEFDLVFFGDESFKGKAEPVPVWEVRIA